jgi:hypothetical protein
MAWEWVKDWLDSALAAIWGVAKRFWYWAFFLYFDLADKIVKFPELQAKYPDLFEWLAWGGLVMAVINTYRELRVRAGLFRYSKRIFESSISKPMVRTYRSEQGELANHYEFFLCVAPLMTGPANLRVSLDQIKERPEYPQMEIAQWPGVLHKGDERRLMFISGYNIGKRDWSANYEHIEKIDHYRNHALLGSMIECKQPHGMEKPRLQEGNIWNLLVRVSCDNCHPVYARISVENTHEGPVITIKSQDTKRPTL